MEIRSLQQRHREVSVAAPRQLTQVIKLGYMLTVSELVIRVALERAESRGAHYRTDYPEEDNRCWLKNIVITQREGQMTLSTAPVESVKMAP